MEEKTKKRKKIIYDILLVVGILMLVAAFVYFYFFYKDYQDAIKEYEDIQKEYTVVHSFDSALSDSDRETGDEEPLEDGEIAVADISDSETELIEAEDIEEPEETEESVHHVDYGNGDISFSKLIKKSEIEWYDMISVNVSGLKSRNGDVRGWLFFERGDISYPILQGSDNEKYLSTTIGGATSKAGSIFMDYNNSPDFSDSRVVIYGHNMRNESMFGSLKYYKRKGFYEDNRYFQIITSGSKRRYEIFSCFELSDTATDLVRTDYVADEDFRLFINHLKNKSFIYGSVYTNANSHIVSLVTCSGTGGRLMVTGALVDTH